MDRKRFRAVGVALLWTITASPWTHPSFAVDPDEISRQGALHARLLRSLEFQATYTGQSVDEEKEESKTAVKFKYYHQGAMFRVETQGTITRGGSTEHIDTIAAYDGDRYQIYLPKERTLSLKNMSQLPNPSQFPNPLIFPYAFLFRMGATYVWSEIESEARWKKALEKATYLREFQERDLTLDVFEVKGAGGMLYEVSLARDFGYYPLHTRYSLQGKPVGTVDITSWTTADIDGQRVLVPSRVAFSHAMGGEKDEGEATIEVATLKVNPKLSAELFSLSPAQAKTINDIDKVQASIDLHEMNTRETSAARGGMWTWFWVIQAVFVLILIASLARRWKLAKP